MDKLKDLIILVLFIVNFVAAAAFLYAGWQVITSPDAQSALIWLLRAAVSGIIGICCFGVVSIFGPEKKE